MLFKIIRNLYYKLFYYKNKLQTLLYISTTLFYITNTINLNKTSKVKDLLFLFILNSLNFIIIVKLLDVHVLNV